MLAYPEVQDSITSIYPVDVLRWMSTGAYPDILISGTRRTPSPRLMTKPNLVKYATGQDL